jgi:hypothetical protein
MALPANSTYEDCELRAGLPLFFQNVSGAQPPGVAEFIGALLHSLILWD